jgi:TPR repeat protein
MSKNRTEALRCFQSAAAKGEPNAWYEMGRIYEAGEGGIKKDLERQTNISARHVS